MTRIPFQLREIDNFKYLESDLTIGGYCRWDIRRELPRSRKIQQKDIILDKQVKRGTLKKNCSGDIFGAMNYMAQRLGH